MDTETFSGFRLDLPKAVEKYAERWIEVCFLKIEKVPL